MLDTADDAGVFCTMLKGAMRAIGQRFRSRIKRNSVVRRSFPPLLDALPAFVFPKNPKTNRRTIPPVYSTVFRLILSGLKVYFYVSNPLCT